MELRAEVASKTVTRWTLLKKQCGASHADKQPDGGYILYAYPNGDHPVRYRVTPGKLKAAQEYLQTGVPPLRGAINPTPLVGPNKRRHRNPEKPTRKR
jgi:hypothetical protein